LGVIKLIAIVLKHDSIDAFLMHAYRLANTNPNKAILQIG